MKRREFIIISVAAGAAISVPFLHCSPGNKALNKVLGGPIDLAHLCDEKAIAGIGKAYRESTPAESGEKQLETLLLRDSEEKDILPSSGGEAIGSLLQEKIRKDFERDHTAIVNGWVLAVTEARQCAYFSLIHS